MPLTFTYNLQKTSAKSIDNKTLVSELTANSRIIEIAVQPA